MWKGGMVLVILREGGMVLVILREGRAEPCPYGVGMQKGDTRK